MSEFGDFVSPHPYDVDAEWAGGTWKQSLDWLRTGNLSVAATSDKLLEKFEGLELPTFRQEWFNEVDGSVPNVQAFIAGHPMSMRRRKRAESHSAPITVFVDLFVSGGVSNEKILERGALILSLVRILANHRPVQLYAADATTSRSGVTVAQAVRIETAPLDLARAAYALCHSAFYRNLIISAERHILSDTGDPLDKTKWTLSQIAAEMFGDGEQVLVIPAAMVTSTGSIDAKKWIEDRIREAAPEILAKAA